MPVINPFKTIFRGDYSDILSGASRSLFMKVAGLACAYLFAFVVARFFGAQTWGEFSLALSAILFGSILGTAGLDMAIVKITASLRDPEDILSSYKPALLIVTVLSVIASLLVFILAEWIAGTLFKNPDLTLTFELSSLAVFPLSIINLNAGTLQGLEKINRYVFIRFVARHISALLLLLIFILIWHQNLIVLIAYIIGLYLITILSFYWLITDDIHPFKSGRRRMNRYDFSRLFKLSMPLLLAGSLVFWNSWIDTIMVGAFLTEQDVGIYNISLKLSGLLLLFWTSVNVVVTPKFSELYSQNKIQELRKVIRYSSSVIFFCTLPLFLILVLFPDFILSIFGNEFVSGKNTLIILSIGNLAGAWAGSEGYFMQMTDSQIAFQNITLASSVLSFLLNYILIPAYGIEGAAIATCISIIFWKWSGVFYIKYRYDVMTAYVPFWGKN